MRVRNEVSEDVKRLNPDVFGPVRPVGAAEIPTKLESELIVNIKQSTDESKLNKTEAAYLAFIKCLGFAWIGVQNVTLKLADDTRYTCDFFVVDSKGHVQGREVKGFFRDDAKVKIKVAARLFPWIEFQIVRKTKTGWEHQTIKP